jgi:hypothetical protein
MAVTYKMPNNVAKVLNHITKALQHIEQQNQNGDSATSMSELMKDLWINLSAEMDSKLTTLEKKLTPPLHRNS